MGVEGFEDLSDGGPKVWHGARGGAQQRLELGEGLLDRVEVRAVGRKVEQARARCFDGLAQAGDLVGRQGVEDDRVGLPPFGGPCSKLYQTSLSVTHVG